MIGIAGWVSFIVLFVIFVLLGFYGARWRRGDLSRLDEWALAGRRLGTFLVWFLVGADLYTAYTFVAVPAGVFAKGALYFFAVPYVATVFALATVVMPPLWEWSRKRGYITAADFVEDRFNSRLLAALVALTGIVAELPYIALQIVGMSAVLAVMLLNVVPGASLEFVSDLALTIAFIILAAFTYTSGLRGATLTAVFKDALIFLSIIAILIAAPIAIPGAFHTAFKVATSLNSGKGLPTGTSSLNPAFTSAYLSLWVGSSLALYLYPHSVNGALSAESKRKLATSTALLPIYGIGLALLALYGILVYADSKALSIIRSFPSTGYAAVIKGNLPIPALAATILPDWLAGVALLGIFIGGMVPAAIMAMAQANLLTRNVARYVVKLTPQGEARLAKWASVFFKFLALVFALIPALAAVSINLQLLGGIIITQTLPPVFLGLVTNRFNKYALVAGWASGILTGVYMFIVRYIATKGASPTLYPIAGHLYYIAVLALAVNIVVTLVGTAIAELVKRSVVGKVKA